MSSRFRLSFDAIRCVSKFSSRRSQRQPFAAHSAMRALSHSRPDRDGNAESRARWAEVSFADQIDGAPNPHGVRSSIDLLRVIARDPSIATHVLDLDMADDGRTARSEDISPPDVEILEVLKDSDLLREAGLDPQICLKAVLPSSCPGRVHYSQTAAALLLSMLPNVREITLPECWSPSASTDQLIDVLIRRAHGSHSSSQSLAKVTCVGGNSLVGSLPFIALPGLKTFWAAEPASGYRHRTPDVGIPAGLSVGHALEHVTLYCTRVEPSQISRILSDAKRLMSLRYYHSEGRHPPTSPYAFPLEERDWTEWHHPGRPESWDLLAFVQAVQSRVGDHLESLEVCFTQQSNNLVQGRADLRGFPRLKDLDISLDFFVCNLKKAGPMPMIPRHDFAAHRELFADEMHEWPDCGKSLADFLPPSLEHLTIRLNFNKDCHLYALRALFAGFAQAHARLPSLRSIFVAPTGYDKLALGHYQRPMRQELDRIKDEINAAGISCAFDWGYSDEEGDDRFY